MASWLLQAVLSAVALAVLVPLFIVLAALIKASSPGPVFYRGVRLGQGKRLFRIYKFRTLVPDAEARIGARLLAQADKAALCTPIGRFLKRTKLDELPQLLNVIRGDMCLVGPRPFRPIFLDELQRTIPGFAGRFAVPPGITGIAQLRGGYYTTPRDKLRYDLIYIRRRRLRLDAMLVLLTLVKIFNRLLSTGIFALTVFLFASFVPVELHPLVHVPRLGLRVDAVQLALVLAATAVFVWTGRRDLSLYGTPLNLTVLLFGAASTTDTLIRAVTGHHPGEGSVSLLTGLAIAFLVANTLTTRAFVSLTVRTIALTSVIMALVGLFQAFVLSDAVAVSSLKPEDSPVLETYTRVSSILGSPVVLAVYLVLGIPLLLAEVSRSRTQRTRDFWLVCTTITALGVFFTQTRVGLVALAVAGACFFARRPRHAAGFASAVAVCCALLMGAGLPRFTPNRIASDVQDWTTRTAAALRIVCTQTWLLGAAEISAADSTLPPGLVVADPEPGRAGRRGGEADNTHLTLIAERGLVGWLAVMWLTLGTIRRLRRASERLGADDLAPVPYAIMASLAGFLVSMNGMNTFESFPIQVFFWNLIGIGVGITAHLDGRRRNLVWRFGDAGD